MEYVYNGINVILTPDIVEVYRLTTSQICYNLRTMELGVDVFKLTQVEAIALTGKGPRNGLFLITRAGYLRLIERFGLLVNKELMYKLNKSTSTSLTKAGDSTRSEVRQACQNTIEAINDRNEEDQLLDLMSKIVADRQELSALRTEVKQLRSTLNSIKSLVQVHGG